MERLTDQIRKLLPTWRRAAVVAPLKTGRGAITKAGNGHVRRMLLERAAGRRLCLTRPNLLSHLFSLPILLNTSPASPLFRNRTNGSRVESCCHSYSVDSAISCAISLP